jgi:hypothetical protein
MPVFACTGVKQPDQGPTAVPAMFSQHMVPKCNARMPLFRPKNADNRICGRVRARHYVNKINW